MRTNLNCWMWIAKIAKLLAVCCVRDFSHPLSWRDTLARLLVVEFEYILAEFLHKRFRRNGWECNRKTFLRKNKEDFISVRENWIWTNKKMGYFRPLAWHFRFIQSQWYIYIYSLRVNHSCCRVTPTSRQRYFRSSGAPSKFNDKRPPLKIKPSPA